MLRLRSLINSAKGRSFSTTTTEAIEGPKTYNSLMQFWHWSMAAGVLCTFGTIQYKQSFGVPKTEEAKSSVGNAMFYHKSFGLLMAMMIAPRLATRMFSTIPKHLPGLSIEHKLAKLSHWTTYGLLSVMCVSGVGMGYFNGFGVPFFGVWKMPGAEKEAVDKDLGGFQFKVHKYAGVAFQYTVAIHVSAVGFSYLRMQPCLSRIAGPVGQFTMMLPFAAVAAGVAYSVKPNGVPEFWDFYRGPYYKKPEPKVEAKPEEPKKEA